MLAKASTALLLLLIHAWTVEGKKCPTACTKDIAGCRASGGKIVGYCVNGLACCDLTYKEMGSCGETKAGMHAINFVSPNFPQLTGLDLVCSFNFVLMEGTTGVKVEFLNITMDGLGFAGNGAGCDSDMFIFKGFKNWTPPPLCGNLTGYTTVIERRMGPTKFDQLKLVALMSSTKYRWKIRLTQLGHPKRMTSPLLAPIPMSPPAARRPPLNSEGEALRSSLKPRSRLDISSFRIDHTGKAQELAQGSNGRESKDRLHNVNLDSESILVETGEFYEDEIESLEAPMIVNGEDTKIEDVPWQVSIRLVAVEPSANDTETDEEGESTSTTTDASNELEGVTIDYDSVLEANDTSNSTSKPGKPEPRNCSSDEGYHFCGGTIISDRFILTASHCFYGNSKSNGMEPLYKVKVVLGDTDTCTGNVNETLLSWNRTHNPQQEYEIETVVFHYGYDNVALLNDVALIKLTKPITYAPNVKRIRLAIPGEDFQGKEAIGSGWGKQNLTSKESELPRILQSSHHFLIRNQSECNAESERLFGMNQTSVTAHPKYLHAFDSILCTSTKSEVRAKLKGNVLVGPGDSGGPLVAQSEVGENVLIGIVSYGIPSEHAEEKGEYVDFFQSVAFFHDWVNLAMQPVKLCASVDLRQGVEKLHTYSV